MILLIRLFCYPVWGAYPLEHDILEITQREPPKNWLVFMEMRMVRCMKSQSLAHQSHGDLLTFLRCQAERDRLKGQCYANVMIKTNAFTYGNSSQFVNEFQKCSFVRHRRIRISLHKLFTVNLTFNNFVINNRKNMQPYQGDCRGFRYYLTIYYNKTSTIYCGKQYPWSIFIDTHTVELKLPFQTRKWVPGNIMAQVEIMDSHFFRYQQGAYMGGIVAWGNFDIHTYHISVEMLHRLRLTVEPFKHSNVIIYDGPRSAMPRLPEHTLANHSAIYVPSTFQVFIVYSTKSGMPVFKISYKSIQHYKPHILMPSHHIHLKNNSGCGDDYVKSWLCPFKIITSVGSQVRLRISLLEIMGPFSDAFESAGIAIYNIFNGTATLVGHIYGNIRAQENVTFISTENQLLVSVYSYAPFTFLSCVFIVDSSPCAGVFVGEAIRPSIKLTQYYAKANISKPFPMKTKPVFVIGLSIQMNVNSKCIVIHIIFLPNEYLRKYWCMNIQLDSSFVKIDTKLVGKQIGRILFEGDYTYIRGERRSRSHEAVGHMTRMFFEILLPKGNRDMYDIRVAKADCLQPCPNNRRAVTFIETNMLQCDLCDYHWFYHRRTQMGHYTVPNRTVSFHRIVGDHPLLISLSSVLNLQAGGHLIQYAFREIDIKFKHVRFMRFDLEDGEIWRASRADLSPPIYHRYNSPWGQGGMAVISPPTFHEIIMRMGIYEYIVLPIHNWHIRWNLFDFTCKNRDANVLMIDDIPELRFVIENIMLPLKLERVPIAKTKQVCGLRSRCKRYDFLL